MASDDEHLEAGKQRTEKLVWARCREPFKTKIDNLSSQWVHGSVSDEQLALEILTMQARTEFVSLPHPESFRIPMEDVTSQLKILTETMLSIRQQEHAERIERRRHVLDCVIEETGHASDKGRG